MQRMVGSMSERLLEARRIIWVALAAALLAAGGLLLVLQLVSQVSAQAPRPEPRPPSRPALAPKAAEGSARAPTAVAAAGPPTRTETVVHDQWTVVCQDRPDGAIKRACSAVLKIVDPNRNQVVFAWVLMRGADGRLAAVMQTPTGVQVPRGITVKVGEGQPRVLPFETCEPQNCEATTALDEPMLRDLQSAAQAVATIYAKDGRGIQFTMPLKGIDKALAAIRA